MDIIIMFLLFGGGYALCVLFLLIAQFSSEDKKVPLIIAFIFLALQDGCAVWGTFMPDTLASSDGFIVVILLSSAILIPWGISIYSKSGPEKRLNTTAPPANTSDLISRSPYQLKDDPDTSNERDLNNNDI